MISTIATEVHISRTISEYFVLCYNSQFVCHLCRYWLWKSSDNRFNNFGILDIFQTLLLLSGVFESRFDNIESLDKANRFGILSNSLQIFQRSQDFLDLHNFVVAIFEKEIAISRIDANVQIFETGCSVPVKSVHFVKRKLRFGVPHCEFSREVWILCESSWLHGKSTTVAMRCQQATVRLERSKCRRLKAECRALSSRVNQFQSSSTTLKIESLASRSPIPILIVFPVLKSK